MSCKITFYLGFRHIPVHVIHALHISLIQVWINPTNLVLTTFGLYMGPAWDSYINTVVNRCKLTSHWMPWSYTGTAVQSLRTQTGHSLYRSPCCQTQASLPHSVLAEDSGPQLYPAHHKMDPKGCLQRAAHLGCISKEEWVTLGSVTYKWHASWTHEDKVCMYKRFEGFLSVVTFLEIKQENTTPSCLPCAPWGKYLSSPIIYLKKNHKLHHLSNK